MRQRAVKRAVRTHSLVLGYNLQRIYLKTSVVSARVVKFICYTFQCYVSCVRKERFPARRAHRKLRSALVTDTVSALTQGYRRNHVLHAHWTLQSAKQFLAQSISKTSVFCFLVVQLNEVKCGTSADVSCCSIFRHCFVRFLWSNRSCVIYLDEALFCVVCLDKAMFCVVCLDKATFCVLCLDKAMFCVVCLDKATFCVVCLDKAMFCVVCMDKATFCVVCLDKAMFCVVCLDKAMFFLLYVWTKRCFVLYVWTKRCFVLYVWTKWFKHAIQIIQFTSTMRRASKHSTTHTWDTDSIIPPRHERRTGKQTHSCTQS